MLPGQSTKSGVRALSENSLICFNSIILTPLSSGRRLGYRNPDRHAGGILSNSESRKIVCDQEKATPPIKTHANIEPSFPQRTSCCSELLPGPSAATQA